MYRSVALLASLVLAACVGPVTAAPADKVCEECIRVHMQQLAGGPFHGRQCGTADEAAAASYIAGELKTVGARGALADGSLLQQVGLSTPRFASAPTLQAGGLSWSHGQQFILLRNPQPVGGPLLRITDASKPGPEVKGAVVFFDGDRLAPALRNGLHKAGAAAVIQVAQPQHVELWSALTDQWRSSTVLGVPAEPASGGPSLLLKPEAAAALRNLAPGTQVSLKLEMGQPELRTTHNVLGVIHGSAVDADANAILLSAHYDHLGVQNGVLYPGADDDASGTAAVMEFARLLGKGGKPKRTVYFALFGCEEEGGLGASYYRAHPPAPLTTLSANLEFEMIGLRDPKHPDELMLTGWERSNLGPTLAAHGARIGPDPYPEENFFQRSDNYQLALKGVVAQTVGGWPIPPTYHQPTDDLAHVDIGFMAGVVQSMAGPVRWLLDSDFTPAWNEGQKPESELR
jgi:aminopeptidase YwaD